MQRFTDCPDRRERARTVARSIAAAVILAVAVTALSTPPLLAATPPRPSYSAAMCADGASLASCKDRLATAIAGRLNALGDTTQPMTAAEGYFYRNPILPVQAFYAYGGCGQTFQFSVFVYKTAAQAAAMYDYSYQHVLDIGGDFHAFNIVRRGRVLYTALTGSPHSNAPPVPTAAFHSLVREVSAPLPAHPRGCRPGL